MKITNTDELRLLSSAATENAEELLAEAKLLNSAGHHSRGYFLAVAALEETGKALIAFNACGRNLNNPKVARRVKDNLLDHQSKITAAFTGSLVLTEEKNLETAIKTAMDLIPDVRGGREPSMYATILPNGSIQKPKSIVRPVAANDMARLADHCLSRAREMMLSRSPPETHSEASDFFFTLSAARIRQLMGHPDFSPFYLERIQQGQVALDEALFEFVKNEQAAV